MTATMPYVLYRRRGAQTGQMSRVFKSRPFTTGEAHRFADDIRAAGGYATVIYPREGRPS